MEVHEQNPLLSKDCGSSPEGGASMPGLPVSEGASLARLYREDAAPVLIKSDDQTLSSETIPPVFSKLREGKLIWEMILKPSKNLNLILERQAVISSFLKSDQPALAALKNEAVGIVKGFKNLRQEVQVDKYNDGIPAIELVRHPHFARSNSDAVEQAKKIVEEAASEIQRGAVALKKLAETLQASKDPVLQALAPELLNTHKKLLPLTCDWFTGPEYDDEKVSEIAREADTQLLRFGALLEISLLCRKDSLAKVSFDSEKAASYEGGFSYLCPESIGNRNKSTAEHDNTVYAGGNMSGKTETGLKQPLFIQLMAQAFGYTSAERANLHVHDSFFYLDRTHSSPERKLSSFGVEMANLNEMCAMLGNRPFICFDEFCSSTSPQDQLKMLYGVAVFLAKRGAHSSFATHNERYITMAQKLPDHGVYHFEVRISEKGEVTYTYRLCEGPADSDSIRIAESLGFDPGMVAIAKEFNEGMPSPAKEPEKINFRRVERYTETERAGLKAETASFGKQFGRGKNDPALFVPYSYDSEIKAGLSWFGCHDLPLTGEIPWWEGRRKRFFILDREIVPGGDNSQISQIIWDSPVLTSKELLERQKMFGDLAACDCYDELKVLREEILWSRAALESLGRHASWLLQFNRYLNPFHGHGSHDAGQEVIMAEAYLKLHAKVLGDNFQHKDWLDFASNFKALSCETSKLLEDMTLEALADILDAQRKKALEPGQIEKLKALQEKYFKDMPAPDFRTVGDAEKLMKVVGSTDYWQLREEIIKDPLWRELQKEFAPLLTPVENIEKIRSLPEKLAAKLGGKPLTVKMFREFIARDDLSEEEYRQCHDVYSDCMRAVSRIPIPDKNLSQRIAEHLKCPLSVRDDEITYPCEDSLEHSGSKLSTFMRHSFPEETPALSAYDTDLESIRGEIEILASFQQEALRREHDPAYGFNVTEAVTLFLETWTRKRNPLADFLSILRSYDSIHLHRLANSVEQEFAVIASPLREVRSEFSLGPFKQKAAYKAYDRIAELLSDGKPVSSNVSEDDKWSGQRHLVTDNPAKPFQHLSIAYCKHFKQMWEEVTALDMEWNRQWREFRVSDTSSEATSLQKLAEGKRLTSDDYRYICRALWESCPDVVSGLGRAPCDEADCIAAYELLIENSPFLEKVKKHFEWKRGFEERVRSFAEWRDLELNMRSHSTCNDALVEAACGKFNSFVNLILNYQYRPHGEDKLTQDLTGACSLALYGRHIAREGYCPVEFNDDGVLEIVDCRHILNLSESVPQSFFSDPKNRLRLLSGPQMSGKTYHEKTATLALCSGLTTGFAPARVFKTPMFEGIFFVDRITGKDDLKLSAAGHEFRTWNSMNGEMEKRGPCWGAIDEAFSTLSPRYQEAFTWAGAHRFIEKGHYGAIAMHNHDGIDTIDKLNPSVSVWHFGFDIDPQGIIHFDRNLTPGHAMSEAIPVARTYGVHREILEAAESL